MNILSGLFKHKTAVTRFSKISLIGIGILSICAITFSPFISFGIALKEGQIAHRTISSPHHIEFQTQKNKRDTETLKQQAIDKIDTIYVINTEINQSIQNQMTAIFTEIRNIQKTKQSTGQTPPIPQQLAFLAPSLINTAIALPNNTLNTLEFITAQLTNELLKNGITEINQTELTATINTLIKKNKMQQILNMTPITKQIIIQVIGHSIQPNYIIDETKTQEAIEKGLADIKPIKTIIREKQPIIYKGETITKEHIESLKALNLYGFHFSSLKLISILLITITLCFLIERFIFFFSPKIHQNSKYFALIGVITATVLLISRILISTQSTTLPFEMKFLIPIAISAMTLSVLVTPNISLMCGSGLAILITLMINGDYPLLLYLFLSTTVTAFATFKKSQRNDMIVSGYIIGLCNSFFVLCIGLFQDISSIVWYIPNMTVAFASAVLSAMICLAIIPYLESAFKITTRQSLLELDINHPILKRLMRNAPGTYQHSLMVANLAETAAETVHADPVLCRVGAYFHDIGKIKHPLFFAENQFPGENPHATLSPRISKKIIESHVNDGLELAEKYKLPAIIRSFIAQHHGTTLISFFYTQALHTEKSTDPEKLQKEFRYPGPKPQFKESAIVMLADSVEATVRAMDKPSFEKIEATINRIFKDKIADHQFNECPISLKEISAIKASFMAVFKGVYHQRIDYQEQLQLIINSEENK